MSGAVKTFTLSGTTPASASTAVVATIPGGLKAFDWFMVDGDLVGATGGTLNLYLQREVAPNTWRDWCAFPQIAAGGAAVSYTATVQPASGFTTVGTGSDATPAPALAAGTMVGGHPGDKVRLVAVAGASTSAGAAVTVRVTGVKSH